MPFFKSIGDQTKYLMPLQNSTPESKDLSLTCTWSFMNRFVERIGLTVVPEQFAMEGKMLKGGYDGLFKIFDLK
ncbi:hypothetical protein [Lutimonas zeaxanthinifaciens]|uniref:hypothetical protein n=1 Tax=Lutimonas zeaxanthinifaciens TaxID=3060215 RepID=UPI00265CB367|nr:hypothetical protein [Lutimonas sp. YSD2104]WKK67122.1 hypothetical protein QZH61_05740 [Lutimonas sp. YSD2104]